jgi:hypothetical protein
MAMHYSNPIMRPSYRRDALPTPLTTTDQVNRWYQQGTSTRGTGAYAATFGRPSRNQVLLGWLSLDERIAAEQSLRQQQTRGLDYSILI